MRPDTIFNSHRSQLESLLHFFDGVELEDAKNMICAVIQVISDYAWRDAVGVAEEILEIMKLPLEEDETLTLDPCPICGSISYALRHENGLFYVTCGYCPLETRPEFFSKEDAIEFWNYRDQQFESRVAKKTCPECGGVGIAVLDHQAMETVDDERWKVKCIHCGAETVPFNTMAEALSCWDDE